MDHLAADPNYKSAKDGLDKAVLRREQARGGGDPQEQAAAATAWLAASNAERTIRQSFLAKDSTVERAQTEFDAAEAVAGQQASQEEAQHRADLLKESALPDPIQVGDLKVGVVAGVGKVPLSMGGETDGVSANPQLMIMVVMINQSDVKKIDYDSWDPDITIGDDLALKQANRLAA
jgi:hypothetical protein